MRATFIPQAEQNVAVAFSVLPHCLQNLLFVFDCGTAFPQPEQNVAEAFKVFPHCLQNILFGLDCDTALPQPEQNVAVTFRVLPQCKHFTSTHPYIFVIGCRGWRSFMELLFVPINVVFQSW